MNEQRSFERSGQEHPPLDERLSMYYGSALEAQPLPASSWQRVRSQLGSSSSPWRWLRWPPLGRRCARSSSIPSFIEDAFMHLLDEAHLPPSASRLSCSINAHIRHPQVRVIPLGRRNIILKLPTRKALTLEPAEIDVLLASGLARYLYMRKPAYILSRLSLYSIIPLAWLLLIVLSPHSLLPLNFLIVSLLCLVLFCVTLLLLHRQGQRMVVRADILMVMWLGRSHACRGLHQLAERSHRSRISSWSSLSIDERIRRVCTMPVSIEHERLTLAR